MKRTLLKMVVAVVLASLAAHADEGWTENYQEALARAKAEKKVIFADFAGSDWSKDGKKREAEVFANQEFKDYAAKYLVLLRLDFPKDKVLPKAVQEQNNDLRSKFGVRSLPATVILDSEGNLLGRWEGYAGGGPARTIAKVEACRQ